MSADTTAYPWSVLGLDGPSSDTDIRKAYAARLKSMDQDADPDAFQTLRGAYQYARQLAKTAQNTPGDPVIEDTPPKPDQAGIDPLPVDLAVAPPRPQTVISPIIVDGPSESECVDQMQNLVVDNNFELAKWRKLLNSPALDDLDVAARFEHALVVSLSDTLVRPKPRTQVLSVSAPWIALIENRFGWLSDGLRFERRFPRHTVLRDRMNRTFRHEQSAQIFATKPIQPKRPLIERIITSTYSQWTLITVFAVIVGIWGVEMRFPGYFVVAAGAFFGARFAFNIPASFYFTRHRLEKLRLARLSNLLAGLSIKNFFVTTAMLVTMAVMLVFILVPPEAPRAISSTVVKPQFISHHLKYAPKVSDARSVLRAHKNTPMSSEQIAIALNLPYPSIALKTHRGRIDSPLPAPPSDTGFPTEGETPIESTLSFSCKQNTLCEAHLESSLLIGITTQTKTANSIPARSMLENPALAILVRPSEALRVAAVDETTYVAIPIVEPQDTSRSYIEAKFAMLTTSAQWNAPQNALEIHVNVIDNTETGWLSRECLLEFNPSSLPHRISSILKNRDEARRTLCTLPYNLVQVDFSSCTKQSSGKRYCQRDFLEYNSFDEATRIRLLRKKLYEQPSATLVQLLNGKGLVTDPKNTGQTHWVERFDTPEDQMILALAQRWGGTPYPMPTDAKNVAVAQSDQIIRDYLTVFWDAPRPETLQTYLTSHPELGLEPAPPTQSALDAAVTRQRHLVNLYRTDPIIATAILDVTFNYLRTLDMLR